MATAFVLAGGVANSTFGHLQNLALDRFTLGGRKKVDAQWKLYIEYALNKPWVLAPATHAVMILLIRYDVLRRHLLKQVAHSFYTYPASERRKGSSSTTG